MMEEVRATLRAMIEEEQISLESLQREANRASRSMLRWLLLGGAFSLGLMVIIFAFLLLSWATYREMDEENKKHADELVEGSDDDL